MAHEVMVVLELTQERDPIQSSTTYVDIDLHLGRSRVERKFNELEDGFLEVTKQIRLQRLVLVNGGLKALLDAVLG